MGTLHDMIEEAAVPSWYRHCLLMGGEVIVYVGEYSMGYIIDSYRQIIILWSGYGQEDVNDVIDEKRGEDDECRAMEMFIPEDEIPQRDQSDEHIIAGISQMHQLTPPGTRKSLREQQGRLTAK